jgi:hypothetical protein
MNLDKIVKIIFIIGFIGIASLLFYIAYNDHACSEKGGIFLKGDCYKLEKIK